jgi:hypothetical protein
MDSQKGLKNRAAALGISPDLCQIINQMEQRLEVLEYQNAILLQKIRRLDQNEILNAYVKGDL